MVVIPKVIGTKNSKRGTFFDDFPLETWKIIKKRPSKEQNCYAMFTSYSPK